MLLNVILELHPRSTYTCWVTSVQNVLGIGNMVAFLCPSHHNQL
jgi:hypothetical protein